MEVCQESSDWEADTMVGMFVWVGMICSTLKY